LMQLWKNESHNLRIIMTTLARLLLEVFHFGESADEII
jgi:hypothetical protein